MDLRSVMLKLDGVRIPKALFVQPSRPRTAESPASECCYNLLPVTTSSTRSELLKEHSAKADSPGATSPHSVPMLDLQRQFEQIRAEVLAAVGRVCASQHYILGPEVEAFERELAGFCGAGDAVGCASGTDALWLALVAAGVQPGDQVLTTPFSFFASAWLFLSLNDHGWESNRLLAIGIGGGMGWVMLLNVWGVIWRIQKRLIQWTRDNATNGTPIPDKAKAMARQAFLASRANAFLSVVMLFLHGCCKSLPHVREVAPSSV